MSEIAILMTVIGIYAIGAWITLFVIGMMGVYKSITEFDSLVFGLVVTWPITWVITIICGLWSLIADIIVPWWAMTKVGKVVNSALALLLLPFRPIALAKCLRDWLDKRAQRKRFAKGRECDGTMAAALAAVEKEGK